MPTLFPPVSNTLARLCIYGAVFLFAFLIWFGATWNRSAWWDMRKIAREQPLQFSHKHHVGDDGIDCRYCHTSVEDSSYATIPPTSTCMNCHSQIWAQSAMLAPVRQSFTDNVPILWSRVYDLPDYVYFNHGIHVHKGIGCATCHGRVDEQPAILLFPDLQMRWCLDCHRDPAPRLRPLSEIFNLAWEPPANRKELGQRLMAEYHIRGRDFLTSCDTCHR